MRRGHVATSNPQTGKTARRAHTGAQKIQTQQEETKANDDTPH